jgi:hypothetical protein
MSNGKRLRRDRRRRLRRTGDERQKTDNLSVLRLPSSVPYAQDFAVSPASGEGAERYVPLMARTR